MNYFDINHFYKYGFAFVEEFEIEKNYIHQQMKNINWVSEFKNTLIQAKLLQMQIL